MRFTRIHWKLKYFLMTSYPVKMTSPQSSFQWKTRSRVDLSAKKILVGLDQPAACWIYDLTPYFSNFNLWKNLHSKRKSTNQTSFSTKSITLNPMVKSDLVTSCDGTIRFLFFSVAIEPIWLESITLRKMSMLSIKFAGITFPTC